MTTLKEIRRSLGLTQPELAEKINVPMWKYITVELNNLPLPTEALSKLKKIVTTQKPTRSREWTPEHLTKLLEDTGLNQNRLAKHLGVTRQTVSLWLKGAYRPGLKQVVKLEELAKNPLTQSK